MSDADGNVVLSGGAPFTGCLGDCGPLEVCEDTDNGFVVLSVFSISTYPAISSFVKLYYSCFRLYGVINQHDTS